MKKRVQMVTTRLVRESSILYEPRVLNSPEKAVELIRTFIEDSDREMMVVINLDVKNQPNEMYVAAIGSLSACIVHPREIFKAAILANSGSILVAHNHPSGNPKPSQEDNAITKRLKEAGELIGITLLDHIIIGKDGYYSFKENSQL
ncbi:MAG: JAB domain-containing protein [Clostridia bacterium]|nr:JAB domain-containing protein [Clostridia bacterium]